MTGVLIFLQIIVLLVLVYTAWSLHRTRKMLRETQARLAEVGRELGDDA